ncbi:MAG TPA: NAD(P)H-binding protein [Nocardioides sp.]|nr:NAD(P)H-binding protein [Nocardioides sp.]
MQVAITGATGVIGRAAVSTLVAAGHEVRALVRSAAKAEAVTALGATPVHGSLGDPESLHRLVAGVDAVCNVATAVPVGYAGALPGAWKANDRLRTQGARAVVEAARAAGVRRVVQESVSFLYADAGDAWVTESAPLGITRATEPAAVAETHVQDYCCGSRAGVVLRLGLVVGDDPATRWQLRAARRGSPIGLGNPDGWLHAVHTDDLGPAVLAALSAPSGVYNVGADPVRRAEYVAAFAEATGRADVGFLGPVLSRVAGARAEPLARSLRVSAENFTAATGWAPRRPVFGPSWLDGVAVAAGVAP